MLARLFPEVRRTEIQRFQLFFMLAALLLAGQAIGLTVSESLLLSRLGVKALPQALFAASIVTVIGSLSYAAWVGRHRHEDSFIRLLLGAAGVLVASMALIEQQVSWIFPGLFCFYCLTFSLFYTHFYTLAADYFDTFSAKRILPLFGVGATVGELAGGLCASTMSRLVATESLLWVWLGFVLAAAALLVTQRNRFREWKPEQDRPERSNFVGDIKAGMQYLKRSALGKALAMTIASMIFCMAMVQYIYSDVFVARFPKDEDLAAFLGGFLAFTNLLELVIGARLTPWLIRRFGVARANLVHPVGALLTFGLLQLDYTLVPAMLAWMNRKMIQDSLAAPVRALVFNAFPQRFRGQVRAFMEGVVGSSSQALAGIGLMAAQQLIEPRTLVLVGAAIGVVYLVGAALVRREYLRSLIEGVKEGRWSAAAARELTQAQLQSLWQSACQAEELPSLRRLAASLSEQQLLEALQHKSDKVRLAAVEQLSSERVPASLLQDESAEIRLEAVLAFARGGQAERVETLTADCDPRVAAWAMGALGQISKSHPQLSVEALPDSQLDLARRHLDHFDPAVRAAALRRLAGQLSPSRLEKELSDPDERVRLAALEGLSRSQDPLARQILAGALADRAPEVRARAAALLCAFGERAIAAVEPYLHAPRESTVRAALEALAGSVEGQALLTHELQALVRQACRRLVLAQALAEDELLSWTLHRQSERNRRLALHLLALVEGEAVIGSVTSSLRFARSSTRADALEVLSNLGDPGAAELLVILLEDSSLDDKVSAAVRIEPSLALDAPGEQLRERCHHSPDPFIRRAAGGFDPRLKRLYELSQLEFFSGLSLEQLAEVDEYLQEERFGDTESVLKAGEPNDRIYFCVAGELEPRAKVHGEVAALDQGPNRVDVQARGRARLFSLRTARLPELLRRFPELAFPTLSCLTRRLVAVEAEIFTIKQQQKAS